MIGKLMINQNTEHNKSLGLITGRYYTVISNGNDQVKLIVNGEVLTMNKSDFICDFEQDGYVFIIMMEHPNFYIPQELSETFIAACSSIDSAIDYINDRYSGARFQDNFSMGDSLHIPTNRPRHTLLIKQEKLV